MGSAIWTAMANPGTQFGSVDKVHCMGRKAATESSNGVLWSPIDFGEDAGLGARHSKACPLSSRVNPWRIVHSIWNDSNFVIARSERVCERRSDAQLGRPRLLLGDAPQRGLAKRGTPRSWPGARRLTHAALPMGSSGSAAKPDRPADPQHCLDFGSSAGKRPVFCSKPTAIGPRIHNIFHRY
jgi:hypothetical protein